MFLGGYLHGECQWVTLGPQDDRPIHRTTINPQGGGFDSPMGDRPIPTPVLTYVDVCQGLPAQEDGALTENLRAAAAFLSLMVLFQGLCTQRCIFPIVGNDFPGSWFIWPQRWDSGCIQVPHGKAH